MDCRAVKENIDLYVDGYLHPAQLRDFEAHAAVCDACRKDIDNTLRLKSALAALGELDAPEGLARSAVRKARARRIPPYAYMTAAAAAVVALAVVLTSAILPNQSFDGSKQSERVMTAESFLSGAGEESAAMDMAPAAIEEPAAEEAPAAEPFVEMEEAPQEEQMAAATRMDEDMVLMSAPEQLCIVNVPDDRSADVRAVLETIVVEYDIEFAIDSIEGLEVMSFVLSEDALEAIIALTSDLPLDGEPSIGQVIEFVFNTNQ